MNASGPPRRFDEVVDRSSSSPGKRLKFVCGPHKLDFCTECAMDFDLINTLRHDTENSISSNNITAYMKHQCTDFYQKSRRCNNISQGCVNPRFDSLFQSVMGNSAPCIMSEFVGCCAYLTFVAHKNFTMRYHVPHFLKNLIGPLQSSDALQADREKEKEDINAIQRMNRSNGYDPCSLADDHIHPVFLSCVSGLRKLLHRHGITELGGFFFRLDKATKSLRTCMNPEFHRIYNQNRIPVAGEDFSEEFAKSIIKSQQAWNEYISSQCKGKVPDMDPKKWDIKDIVELLNRHGMRLVPFPERNVLNEIMRALVKFRAASKAVLEYEGHPSHRIPGYVVDASVIEEATTSGSNRFSNGKSKTSKTSADNNKTEEIVCIAAAPQIDADFRMSELSKWHVPDIDDTFSFKHQQYSTRFYQETFDLALRCVTDVAETWYKVHKHPNQDFVNIFERECASEEDTSIVAIRPIELWSFTLPDDEKNTKVPLLGVEYIHFSKSMLSKEFPEDTRTNLRRISCDGRAMEMLISLLRGNRQQFDRDDPTYKALQKKCPKGWKLSAFRPVDPTKRSGIMACPECGKAAIKTCSRCKMVAYCSRKCQAVQWKKHKKVCQAV